jgi:signal transduction histidine kinase
MSPHGGGRTLQGRCLALKWKHKTMYTFETAAAAHDLRNRLSVAQCETRLLRSRVASTNESHEPRLEDCLDEIDSSLTRTGALMEDLLEIAMDRVQADLTSHEEHVDLTECVSAVVALHRQTSAAHQFVVRAAEARLVGAWNAVAIAHLISNLLSNAVKFSRTGSAILLTLDREESVAVLRVADHGIGIPAADLSHVFEPFYRACNSDQTTAGLGLGLASARMTVSHYGGTIFVDSQVGVGTVVSVRLPLSQISQPTG